MTKAPWMQQGMLNLYKNMWSECLELITVTVNYIANDCTLEISI